MRAARAVVALAALAHEHRLAVHRMLVEAGPQGLSAGTIAARLKLPASSLTFHLQHLQRAGLVGYERMSRQLIYSANFAAMDDLIHYLTENCCGRASSRAPVCAPQAQTRAPKRAARGA